MYWNNRKTGEYEYFEKMPPTNRFKEFISQCPAAQSLYDMYAEDMGKEPVEAMRLVLEASVGTKST